MHDPDKIVYPINNRKDAPKGASSGAANLWLAVLVISAVLAQSTAECNATVTTEVCMNSQKYSGQFATQLGPATLGFDSNQLRENM
jgi:hypothetical protein